MGDPAKKGVCSNFLCDVTAGEGQDDWPDWQGHAHARGEGGHGLHHGRDRHGHRAVPRLHHRLFTETAPAGEAYKGLAWLFLGVANSDALLYDEEWQAAKSKFPDNFRVDYALSREEKN